MKIAIAGKGGSGKTTIAGTLARVLARRNLRVLAVDGDTNPNLAISIGIPRATRPEIAPLPSSLLQRVSDAEGKSKSLLTMSLEDVKHRFGVAVIPNLTLVELGRVDHAGAGWKCHAHATVRELTARISETSGEHVVLDMEAGVEHLSRGTTRNTNTLLVIAEPYYKSLETAARVAALGRELGIAQVLSVANKVRPADRESVEQFARRHNIDLVVEIPYDESVAEADRLGIAPIDHDATGLMVQALDELAGRLLATWSAF